jgi:para-nitrobenzyl esterase
MFGPIAPQDINPARLAKRGLSMAEDCLSLNVWTPSADAARRPVVVFVHGGGVVSGFSSAPLFDGKTLAQRGDLVVVTINFRLGALGSLFAPQRLGVEGDPGTNLAFRDQLAALHWVRHEIGAFGGNPADVTVVGQSSGAVAIACMLASPAARGLFDRVILQSGGLERVRWSSAAAEVAGRFFAALGSDDLAAAPVEQILSAQRSIPTGFVPPVGPFHHAVDGDVIPEHPLAAATRRPLHEVPMLAGTTRDEWRVFDTVLADEDITDEYIRERARALSGVDADIDAMLALYAEEHSAVDSVLRRRAVAGTLVTDFHFGAPTDQFARAHARHGNPVFRYELQWPSPRDGVGACHDTCLPLVFGTMDAAPSLAGTGADVTSMSETVQDSWISFIRTGDPTTSTLGAWPSYDEDRTTMLLGSTSGAVTNYRRSQLALWEGRYPASG